MLVIVQGHVLNTENIYDISPITESSYGQIIFGFEIKFLNAKEFVVRKKTNIVSDIYRPNESYYIFNPNENSSPYIKAYYKESAIYKNERLEFETGRQKLINLWNEHKTKIEEIKF